MNSFREQIEDLPEELKQQLRINKKNDVDDNIVKIISGYDDKQASIDEILVRYYRNYNKILTRAYLNNRLLQMVKGNKIVRVEKKKGLYKLI